MGRPKKIDKIAEEAKQVREKIAQAAVIADIKPELKTSITGEMVEATRKKEAFERGMQTDMWRLLKADIEATVLELEMKLRSCPIEQVQIIRLLLKFVESFKNRPDEIMEECKDILENGGER